MRLGSVQFVVRPPDRLLNADGAPLVFGQQTALEVLRHVQVVVVFRQRHVSVLKVAVVVSWRVVNFADETLNVSLIRRGGVSLVLVVILVVVIVIDTVLIIFLLVILLCSLVILILIRVVVVVTLIIRILLSKQLLLANELFLLLLLQLSGGNGCTLFVGGIAVGDTGRGDVGFTGGSASTEHYFRWLCVALLMGSFEGSLGFWSSENFLAGNNNFDRHLPRQNP